jgi:hypothetical protein
MAKKDYTAAEAVKLYIGNLEFDAIRIIETGEYRMSQSQMLRAVNRVSRYFGEFESKTPDKAQRLKDKGFSWCRVRVKYHDGQRFRYAETLSLKDVRIFWNFENKNGNEHAETLVDVLTDDSLRDRFDQVYGTRRTIEERRIDDIRVMDTPRKFHPLFGDENMDRIASFLKVGRNHPKLANWMWQFVYHTLDATERAKLDNLNPVQPNGHRKQTIHQWLEENATEKHKQHFDKVLMVVNAAPSEQEFGDLFARLCGGKFQCRLFNF